MAIKRGQKKRIIQATSLFEAFTGHTAEKLEIADVKDYDTAIIVGDCLGIMYEAIRDGKKYPYCHEFKKTSRPQMCITSDGQQIILIDGKYLFTDEGITDL